MCPLQPRAAFARVSAAEDAYYDHCTAPMHRAARRLIGTPIPAHPEQASSEAERPCRRTDLLALLGKIDLILDHQFETFGGAAEHPCEVPREDVKQLATAAARQIGASSL